MNLRVFCYKAAAVTCFAAAPVVARVSIELTTSALWARRSSQLSYLAMVGRLGVEPSGCLLIGQVPSPVG